jgi:ABC-type phosphate transport system permease subunit
MFKLISNNKIFIFSLLSLVVAFALAMESAIYNEEFAETNWAFVCMSAIFTIAGVVGIGYSLLRSKDK